MKTELPAETRALLTPGKLAVQIAGFLVGLGLLAWIVRNAIREGDWQRIAHAPPLLVAGLMGCTVISTLLNGATFWVTMRPVRRLPFWDLQRLNLVTNLLNYAPVRLGAVGRVLYHLKVDGLTLLRIGAWFTIIGYTLALAAASFAVATIVCYELNWLWFLLVAGQLVLGGLALRLVAGLPLLVRHGRGLDLMIADPASLWGALVMRCADLGAFAGRMALAAAILEIALPPAHVLLLALVALMASLIPFGRFGIREFCVAAAAERLSMLAGDVESRMNQLALVESAGEVLIYVPLGAALLPWFRRRWKAGRWNGGEDEDEQ